MEGGGEAGGVLHERSLPHSGGGGLACGCACASWVACKGEVGVAHAAHLTVSSTKPNMATEHDEPPDQRKGCNSDCFCLKAQNKSCSLILVNI